MTAWTAGLVLLREIYEKLKTKHKYLVSYLIYLAILFLVEYISYYIFKIKLNSDYPSLLRLGIIHATLGMKLFYILAGPIYLSITDYVKNHQSVTAGMEIPHFVWFLSTLRIP